MPKTRVVAAVDIGSSKIATLLSQYNEEEDKISVVGVSQVSSRGVRKGQIVDIEEAARAVVESVEKSERMAGFSLERAFVSLGGGHIQSRNSHGVVAVADPSGEIDQSDIERVVDAAKAISMPEAREVIHVIPREYKVDGETNVKDPKGMSGVRLEVETHLVTGSSTAVKNIMRCVSEVGVDVAGLVFTGLAGSTSVLTDTERELGVVLVDVGAGTTSICVWVEGSLAYSSVLPIGGKNVTNDIAAGLRVSLETAEKIKIGLGEKGKAQKEGEEEGKDDELTLAALGVEDEDRKVSKKTLTEGIIRPRLNEIFTMVGMELSNAEVVGKTPAGAVLTGGGAMSVGALDSVKRMLSLPARIGRPTGVSGLIDEIGDPSYAVAVGLLLYGVKTQERLPGLWPKIDFLARLEQIPVRGLVNRVSQVLKNLLP